MAVTVRTSRISNGSHVKVTHAQASTITVKDGHLVTERWSNGTWETVAVYAPGQWLDATTEEPAEK